MEAARTLLAVAIALTAFAGFALLSIECAISRKRTAQKLRLTARIRQFCR